MPPPPSLDMPKPDSAMPDLDLSNM
jgi:hypothetical protein